jgi:hypothetical protein
MQSKAATVKEYLADLPEDRRAALNQVRKVFREHLDPDYKETIQYGMIAYVVPHRLYPPGYHCDPKLPLQFAALASQKQYMSLYLCVCYGNSELDAWFRDAWASTGKKLDMGKSCIRFKRAEDLALDVVGKLLDRLPVAKFIANYEASVKQAEQNRAARKRPKT